MLSHVEVTNPQGNVFTLPIGESSVGLYVEDIQGLEPSDATIVSSDYAALDGAQYQSSRFEKRNMVFRLGLDPDFIDVTADEIRETLYTWFMPRSRISFRFFFTQGYSRSTSGMVEDFDHDRFSKELEVSIPVICFDPYFYDSDGYQLVEGETVSDGSFITLPYIGNAPTGIFLSLPITREVGLVQLTLQHGESSEQLEFIRPMTDADILYIESTPGKKSIRLNRLGFDLKMLGAMSPYSDWPLLHKGDNQFRVYVEGAPMPYTVQYQIRDAGI